MPDEDNVQDHFFVRYPNCSLFLVPDMIALPKTVPADSIVARRHMVESQLRPNRIHDERILNAMGSLPRESFVPASLAGIAYADCSLEVAPQRFLLEPMVLALLIQECGIKEGSRVLDIGMATGYSTAVFAALGANVVALESDQELLRQAEQLLTELGHGSKIQMVLGSLPQGAKAQAPFDVILLNGGVEAIPDELLRQLGEGGKLLAVIRRYGPAHVAHIGEARVYEKIRGVVSYRPLFNANVKRLPSFDQPKTFSF